MLDWAAPPRRGRGDPVLRLHVRRREARARRHLRRHAAALRDRGGAARHRRARAAGLRRGPARGAPVRAERRRAHRHRPDRRARAARADGRARDARAVPRSRTRRATASCPPPRTARSRRSSRRAAATRPRTASTPAPTCSSARWSSLDSGRAAPVSFEREVFPSLVGNGLYGFDAAGYWIDIGTPERYLEATWDLLAGRVELDAAAARRDGLARLRELPRRGRARRAAERARPALLGGHGRAVERSVLHERVIVGADAAVVESVLGERVRVGERRAHGTGRDGRRRRRDRAGRGPRPPARGSSRGDRAGGEPVA